VKDRARKMLKICFLFLSFHLASRMQDQLPSGLIPCYDMQMKCHLLLARDIDLRERERERERERYSHEYHQFKIAFQVFKLILVSILAFTRWALGESGCGSS
jgi:hypothetical protein